MLAVRRAETSVATPGVTIARKHGAMLVVTTDRRNVGQSVARHAATIAGGAATGATIAATTGGSTVRITGGRTTWAAITRPIATTAIAA